MVGFCNHLFVKKLTFFILLFLLSVRTSHAAPLSVVIVNQIRGNESCCHPGSNDLIQSVINVNKGDSLPVSWALRYDVFEDNKQLDLLNNSGELGLLLEITPQLAFDSNVEYRGKKDGTDWYYGKHSLLIGYTVAERKRLIDQAMLKFNRTFRRYPSFTAAWMIDAWSLNYIQNTYDVKFHELTKEQYETDSYTLYGGIFNAGYYPSRNYPLLPGFGDDRLNIVMVRQTVSDMLRNYGSSKSIYTSQPNDYLNNPDKKDLNYFRELLKTLISNQLDQVVAVLGFENSFSSETFKTEYIRQLEVIQSLKKQNLINVLTPSEYAADLKKKHQENEGFYLTDKFAPDQKEGVLWYFGNNYRARMIVKNHKLIITDLRSYASVFDPYRNTPAENDYAYWVIPYLIDGSQMYSINDKQKMDLEKNGLMGNTVSDFYTDPFGIIIPYESFELSKEGNSVEIQLNHDADKSLRFNPENIKFAKILSASFGTPINRTLEDIVFKGGSLTYTFAKHPDFRISSIDGKTDLGWDTGSVFVSLFTLADKNERIELSPSSGNNTDINKLNSILQPDRSDLPVDSSQSVFYWNNKTAIAGRNPIRLFILPLNKYGRPTAVKNVVVNTINPSSVKTLYPDDYSFRLTPWFVDITADQPVKENISVTVDGIDVVKNIQIEFVADCRKKFMYCLQSPVQLIKYGKELMREGIRNTKEKLRNFSFPHFN